MIKDARCIFVTGRRGSGKTTLTQALIEGCPRVIAFDPIGQYQREFRWPGAASLAELHALLARGWRSPFRLAMTPGGDFAGELHKLSLYLWEAMAPYERGRERKKLTLVVEEMNLSVPVTKLPESRRGFERLVLQGRHRGIEIIGVSQRPALVSADFRSSCAETYVLPVGIEDWRIKGPRFAGAIASLQPHEWLHFAADGSAARGRNRPPPAPAGRDGGGRS